LNEDLLEKIEMSANIAKKRVYRLACDNPFERSISLLRDSQVAIREKLEED